MYWWNPWYGPSHRDTSWPHWSSTSASTFRVTHACPTWPQALRLAEALRSTLTEKPKIRRRGGAWEVSYAPRLNWTF